VRLIDRNRLPRAWCDLVKVMRRHGMILEPNLPVVASRNLPIPGHRAIADAPPLPNKAVKFTQPPSLALLFQAERKHKIFTEGSALRQLRVVSLRRSGDECNVMSVLMSL
jgi:hypothetical protein